MITQLISDKQITICSMCLFGSFKSGYFFQLPLINVPPKIDLRCMGLFVFNERNQVI